MKAEFSFHQRVRDADSAIIEIVLCRAALHPAASVSALSRYYGTVTADAEFHDSGKWSVRAEYDCIETRTVF